MVYHTATQRVLGLLVGLLALVAWSPGVAAQDVDMYYVPGEAVATLTRSAATPDQTAHLVVDATVGVYPLSSCDGIGCTSYPADVGYAVVHDASGDSFALGLTSWAGCQWEQCAGSELTYVLLHHVNINRADFRAWASTHQSGTWSLRMELHVSDNIWARDNNVLTIAMPVFTPTVSPEVSIEIDGFETNLDGDAGLPGQRVDLELSGVVYGAGLPGSCAQGTLAAIPIAVGLWGETAGGDYVYLPEIGRTTVDPCDDPTSPNAPVLGFSDLFDFNAEAVRAFLVGNDVTAIYVEARVDPDDTLDESNESDNVDYWSPPRGFLPLDGGLDFGGAATTITRLDGSYRDLSGWYCQLGELAVWGVASWPASLWTGLSDPVLPLDFLCATVSWSPDGYHLAFRGNYDGTTQVQAQTTTGTLGGMAVELSLGFDALGAQGGGFVTLPEGVTAHEARPTVHNGMFIAPPLPDARGAKRLYFVVDPVESPYELLGIIGRRGTDRLIRFLHGGGLPFSFLIDTFVDNHGFEFSMVLDPGGLWARQIGTHYLRAAGRASNDGRFAVGAAGQMEDLVIDARGVRTLAAFDATSFRAHYPAAEVSAVATDVRIEESRVVAGAASGEAPVAGRLPRASWSITPSTQCGSCGSKGFAIPIGVSAVGPDLSTPADEGLGADGTVAFRAKTPGAIFWGPLTDPPPTTFSFGEPLFQRYADGDDAAILVAPGWTLTATAGASQVTAADALLGSWRPTASGSTLAPGASAGLGSGSDARAGTGAFAGLTVGPEVYRDAQGQPVKGAGSLLGGNTMRLGLGGTAAPQWANLASTDGTKYVVRGGGITGAFNFGSSPAGNVYGYPMTFTRFAFRQRANIVDPFTWIDGAIALGGRAGFGTGFSSLGLTCTGQLSGGTVVPPAEGQQLAAWSAPFDPYGIEFRAKVGAGTCDSGARDLWVAGHTTVKSLARPLDLDAAWTPGGEPVSAKLEAGENTLDTPAGGGRGFSVSLRTEAVLGPATAPAGKPMLGWFGLAASLRLPFWKVMPVDLRLENACDGDNGSGTCALANIKATPALVLNQGQALADQDASTNTELAPAAIANAKAGDGPARLVAEYSWGGSGFDLALPAYYSGPAGADRPGPELTGIKLEKEYPFVKVNAGVAYVRPEKTRAFFGASADFEKLSLTGPLHVDLQDPKSVGKIDYRLCQLMQKSGCTDGPIPDNVGADFERHPVGSVVKAMQAPASFVLKNSGPGFQNLIRDGIAKVFEAAGGPRIIDDLAKAIAHVQALPARAVSEVFGLIEAEANKAIGALTNVAADAAATLYQQLPDSIDQAIAKVQATAQGGAAWYTDQANAALAQTVRDLRALLATSGDFGGAVSAVNDAVSKVKGALDTATGTLVKIRQDMDGALVTALGVLDQVDGLLSQLTSLTTCPAGTNEPSGNAMWQKFAALHDQIKGLLGGIKTGAGTVTTFASGIGGLVGVDTSKLTAFTQKMTGLVTELEGLANTARAKVGGSLCKLPFASTLAEVSSLVSKVRNGATSLKNTLDGLVSADGKSGLIVTTLAQVKPRLDQIAALVASLEQGRKDVLAIVDQLLAQTPSIPPLNLGNLTVAAKIRDMLDKAIAFANPGQTPVRFCDPGADNVCQASETFVAPLGAMLSSEVGAVIGTVAGVVQDKVADLMKLVPFPSGDDLRRIVYDKVLNNPIIGQLEALVHENLALILKPLDQLGADLLGYINRFVKEAFEKLDQLIASLLSSATAAFKSFPLKGGSVDGYAEINDRELLRLHIGAVFKMNDDKKGSGNGNNGNASAGGSKDNDKSADFSAALDVTSWAANGKGKNCGVPASGDTPGQGLLDANITVRNVPIKIGTGNLGIRELSLGMTLGDLSGQGKGIELLGINGRIYTSGSLEFTNFKLYDMGLEVGVGAIETYLGATAAASFQGINLKAAFLAGKTCNDEVIKRLDPEAGSFMALPNGVFSGIFVRGRASIPIWNVGCLLRVGAGAGIGFWYLDYGGSTTVGGILEGSVYGNLMCIVSVRGGVKLMGQIADGDVSLLGEAWGVGGIGLCEPENWIDIPASRNDDWCGTADVSMKASYKQGSFKVDGVDMSALH